MGGPQSSQDLSCEVPHFSLLPQPPVGQVPPAERRQQSVRVPTAAAGSAQQTAGPVTRGRKRVATPHSEDVEPQPPFRPRGEQQSDQPQHPARRYTC